MQYEDIVGMLCAQHCCEGMDGFEEVNRSMVVPESAVQPSLQWGARGSGAVYHAVPSPLSPSPPPPPSSSSSGLAAATSAASAPAYPAVCERILGQQQWGKIATLLYAATKQQLFLRPAEVEACYYQLLLQRFHNDVHALRRYYLGPQMAALRTSVQEHHLQTVAKQLEDDEGSRLSSVGGGVKQEASAAAVAIHDPCSPLPLSGTSSQQNQQQNQQQAVSSSEQQLWWGRGTDSAATASGVSHDGDVDSLFFSASPAQTVEEEMGRDAAPYPTLTLTGPVPGWTSGLTAAQRDGLRRLRCETAVPLETLTSLLQRFTLVEGSNVFFDNVGPDTMVEYNGMQAGPYRLVIRVPLSLMAMRRCMVETRHRYDHSLLTSSSAATHNTATHDGAGMLIISSNPPPPLPLAPPPSSRRLELSYITTQLYQPQLTPLPRPPSSTIPPPAFFSSQDYQLLTLADLERMIWHIAANCVIFNAPETSFRPTALKFATACSSIIQAHCQQQLPNL